MTSPLTDLAVLFEHPEWQKPLFAALHRRGIAFAPIDLKCAAFADDDEPMARLYFNQASPSAYVRGNARAVPYALAYMRSLESRGVRVLNGSRAFSLELSKSAQAALMRRLGVPSPRTIAFDDVDALRNRLDRVKWPALLKPEQGGSGARINVVDSYEHLRALLAEQPSLWLPDGLLLLQEYFPHDGERGIVRMEFLGGELLYAMRVVAHGRFNLCPSEVCNPVDGSTESVCETPAAGPPVEFHPFAEVPSEAVAMGRRLVTEGGLDVGAVEYLVAEDGRTIFYDINANSNLRPAIAEHFGFDPFERVVDYLVERMGEVRAPTTRE